MTVPWLFQSIRARSATGTAVFDYIQDQTAAKVVKKVYFKNGDITFAASNLQEDWLGRYLVRAGKLTEQQCAASEELVARTGKKQGAILVELGFLTPQTLVDGVKLHVKQIILSLFPVRMGAYNFEEGPLPMANIIPLQMSTGNVILEGVTSLDWQAIRKSLPVPTTIVRPITDPSCLFQDASLTDEQRAVFSFIDGKRSIEEICSLSGVGDFNALKAMYLLLALRMAEIGKIKTDAEMEFAREAVREAVRPAPDRKAEQKPQEAPRAAEPEVVATREMIQGAYDALAAGDHYQVLGVTMTATAQELKKAYFRLAKSYHPDRHFDPAMADMKSKLEALFDRIHKAYTILSDQVVRAEYDMAAAKARKAAPQTTEGFVEKRAEGYQEDYKEKVARAAEQFNNGMREFKTGNYWGAVESFTWATRLDPIKAPYFYYQGLCLMNIPRRKHEAEESLQKAIELDATKIEYHIELSNLYLKSGMKAKALGVLNKALVQVSWVDKIQEAIIAAGEGRPTAALTDKVAGAGGAKQAERRKISPAKASEADAQFAKAMKEFKANNFGLAVDIFASATRLDPTNAQYFFYYGLCLTRIPKRSEEAEEPLRKAFELDQTRMEHHYELGSYYLRAGHKAKALGILNNALLRFPTTQKLKEAITAAGGAVAGAAAEEEKKTGMFGRLFKK